MVKTSEGESVQEWFEGQVARQQERGERIEASRTAKREGRTEAPEMEFEFPQAGDYSGSIGGTFGSIKVGNNKKFRTTDPAEQAFIASQLGYAGSLTRSGEKSAAEQAVVEDTAATEEA